jgi:hypothetical protein
LGSPFAASPLVAAIMGDVEIIKIMYSIDLSILDLIGIIPLLRVVKMFVKYMAELIIDMADYSHF